MKIHCKRCKKDFPRKCFRNDKSRKTGYFPWCSKCSDDYHKGMPSREYGSIKRFARITWTGLNGRTVNGSQPMWHHPPSAAYLKKGIMLKLTRKEFYDWCDLNSDKILGIYKEGKKPSVDRIKSDNDYELSNMQIISLCENMKKRVFKTKPISATCSETKKESRFKSITEAVSVGHTRSSIYKCLNGERNFHHGLIWSRL